MNEAKAIYQANDRHGAGPASQLGQISRSEKRKKLNDISNRLSLAYLSELLDNRKDFQKHLRRAIFGLVSLLAEDYPELERAPAVMEKGELLRMLGDIYGEELAPVKK